MENFSYSACGFYVPRAQCVSFASYESTLIKTARGERCKCRYNMSGRLQVYLHSYAFFETTLIAAMCIPFLSVPHMVISGDHFG